jgi:1,4-alpha-glucan branching enzyme
VPDKGVHTVLEAFGILCQREAAQSLASLTILGDGPANYMQHLRERVAILGIGNRVEFLAPVRREQMPEVLSKYDVLIVSSEYAEPIARSMQEGMAMGLLVIGTVTGGSGELLQHEHNGLVFTAADAQSLAAQIARAGSLPGLRAKLAQQGQKDVRANFDIRLTVERIENYLLERSPRRHT